MNKYTNHQALCLFICFVVDDPRCSNLSFTLEVLTKDCEISRGKREQFILNIYIYIYIYLKYIYISIYTLNIYNAYILYIK